jgi:hypothetical protein
MFKRNKINNGNKMQIKKFEFHNEWKQFDYKHESIQREKLWFGEFNSFKSNRRLRKIEASSLQYNC